MLTVLADVLTPESLGSKWIPAFAGMTKSDEPGASTRWILVPAFVGMIKSAVSNERSNKIFG